MMTSMKQPPSTNNMNNSLINNAELGEEEWEDLIGTGTVMKRVLIPGKRPQQDDDDADGGLNMEAPRNFFALIDVETKCNGRVISNESFENFLLNNEADLFPGVHLVIPLMDLDETSLYIFDPKFGYGELANQASNIPANSKLECKITLKLRSPYEDFLSQMLPSEKLKLAKRKKERGKFWFGCSNYQNAITIYNSIADLCVEGDEIQDIGVDDDGGDC